MQVHHQLLAVVRPGLYGTQSQFKWRQFIHIPPQFVVSSAVMTDNVGKTRNSTTHRTMTGRERELYWSVGCIVC